MIALVEEKLSEGGIREDDKAGVFRVRPVERWEKDEHFTADAGIRWGY